MLAIQRKTEPVSHQAGGGDELTRTTNRMFELAALWSIAIAALCVAAYMIHLNRTGEAFGALLGIIPLCLNRIGNLGQSQVMNDMASHLANSTPARKDD